MKYIMASIRRAQIVAQLPVIFLREGKYYVAFTPALDLATQGKTYEEARKNFAEAVNIFFEETVKRGTLDKALRELGWKKQDNQLIPPMEVIGHETKRLPVSYATT